MSCYYALVRHARQALIALRRPLRACETGFNAGHAAIVMLSALSDPSIDPYEDITRSHHPDHPPHESSAHRHLPMTPGALVDRPTRALTVDSWDAAGAAAEYIGFDLGDNVWTLPAAHHLNTSAFPSWVRLVRGDSARTIPATFGHMHASSTALGHRQVRRAGRPTPQSQSPLCDVVSIDGNHTPHGVISDWRAIREHARLRRGTLVLLDDADDVHPIWAEDGLRRVGCVELSGVADDETRAMPMSASPSFCVAVSTGGGR